MTFAAEFASRRPGEVALRGADRSLSWAEVDSALRPAVNALLNLELAPPRRVAVFAENSAQTVLAYVACALAGVSAVAVNFHLAPDEVAFILEDSRASAVLVDADTAAAGKVAAQQAGIERVIGWGGASVTGVVDWTQWTSRAGDAEPPTGHRPLPSLVYTSGSTGRPKGVNLPPTSWVGGDDIAEHVTRLRGNSMIAHGRHLVVGPMYHSGPITGTRLFIGGAPLTVLGRFDAESVLVAIERDRVGSVIMVPTHFQRLLALPDDVRKGYDTSSLKFVLQVGAKCPVDVKRQMIDWWGDAIWESYGASEVGTTCMISAAEWRNHPGSVGRPIPPFDVYILDDEGNTVEANVEGRIYFRDTTGYGIVYHHEGSSDPYGPTGDGTFTLGEVGYLDADGYVYITDRFSDMVVSGGVNIYPVEAETVLGTHPGVADVACVGVPDRDMGERLLAVIVPADPAHPPAGEELIAYCRDRLSHYKCPRDVDFVSTLNRSPMGKLNKRALRDAHSTPLANL